MYNADVNLGCLVCALWTFPAGGGANVDVNVHSMRIYRATSTGLHIFVLIFELVYVVFTLYMIYFQIEQIRRFKFKYFLTVTGFLDFTACSLSVIVIVLYSVFVLKLGGLAERYRRGDETVAYFSYLVTLDTAQAYLFGLLLVIGMVKFLHVLRFNPSIWHFMMIIRRATPKLICAMCIIIGAFISFGSYMHLIAGDTIENYSTMAKTFLTFFEGVLGEVYMDDLEQIHRFFGPFLYILFLFVCMILIYNLMIIVLMEALAHVQAHPLPNEESDILWMLMYKFVQYLGIKVRTH